MKCVTSVCVAIALFCSHIAIGAPAASTADARLRTVVYDPNRVVQIFAQPGFAVHIVLGSGEHIIAAGTGDNSHCDDPSARWCVVALKGEHDVYLNAHANARLTNLFVKTDRRNYSFDLMVLAGKSARGRVKTYLVQFSYPQEEAEAQAARVVAVAKQQLLESRLKATNPPRNWNYTKQVLPGGDAIAPTQMYDDGRFTYLKFPNNREFPAIYMVSDDKSESVVQFHVENTDTMVVHRVAKRFVLREGNAVVGLWNESYDPDGIPPHDGVTVDGVERTIIPLPTNPGGNGVVDAERVPSPAVVSPTSGILDALPMLLHPLDRETK